MEWNKRTTLHLICLIRERPAFWDVKSPEHKNKQKRQEAAAEVALLLGTTIRNVMTKWTILRNQYSREKRKMTDSTYTTNWFAYKKMEALMLSSTPILSINNIKNEQPPSLHTPIPAPPHTPIPPPPLHTPTPQPPLYTSTLLPSCPYKEAVQTLRVMRENDSEKHQNTDDDLTSYGLYIAAHLRKFPSRLQCKARFEINNILYKLDLENMGEYSASVSSMDDNDTLPG